MQRRLFLRASGALAVGCFAVGLRTKGQLANAQSTDAPRSLQEIVPRLMEETRVPGTAIALVQNGKVIWSSGFGIKSSDGADPVDANTVFEAASVSKTVFACAVLKLCEKGILHLDRPLTTYVPWRLLENDSRLDRITVRHILSHSSGLQDWRSGEQPLKIQFPPGDRFMYSGEGYYYLQSVLTHLTGQTDSSQCAHYEAGLKVCATDFDAYMKRHLLAPLGMSSSTYEWNQKLDPQIARGHDVHRKPTAKSKPGGSDVARYGAAGGLLTTANDYAQFIAAIVSAKHGPATASDSFRLGASTLDEMAKPQIKLPATELIDGATSWGLGWGVQERKEGDCLVHSGGQSGFRSLALVSPAQRSGFIVLTNSDHGGKLIYHPTLLNSLTRMVTG